ncbi:MAG: metallophosphoesterase [Acidobacteriota bacterium]
MANDPWWLTRRTALKGLVATGAGVIVGRVGYGVVYERHQIRLERSDLRVVGLPAALDGLRVGLITDIHSSETVPDEDIRAAVDLLRGERPDLVVLGGDYVTDGNVRHAAPAAALLAPLADAPAGAFAVLGNHDDDRVVPAALSARGFEVLRDQRTRITVRGEPLDIAGLRYWTRRLIDVAKVLRGAGPTTLLIAHDPRRLTEAAELDVQLVLAGHTHGGQVVLPGIGAIAARRFPVIAGAARERNCVLYVSRGVGTVVVPLRINCPAEVTVLTLRSAAPI